MEWVGPQNEIEYVGDGPELLVRVTHRRRLIDLWLPLASVVGALAVAFGGGSWLYVVVLLCVCGFSSYSWAAASIAELRVTQTELAVLVVTSLNTKVVHRYWRDIYGIEYSHGSGENDPVGLYTSEPGGGTILIEQVNREEAYAIVDKVYRCFYSIETKARSVVPPLDAIRSSIITLFGGEKIDGC